MDGLFNDLPYVVSYVDDIVCVSETFDEHMNHLKTVLKRIADAGLKLNGEKTVFLATTLKLLGHIVSNGEIRMDPAKVEALVNRKPPRSLKDTHTWICSLNFYRKHIEAFARIARPIYNLFKKEQKFVWSNECQLSYDQLIKILSSYPILRTPNFLFLFILYCDASNYAIGAILAQEDQPVKDEYVCEYASKMLKGAELRWPITVKELYAIVWAINHFAIYLRGVKFRCVTDHKALIYLKAQKDYSSKLTRFSILLDQFDIEFVFRKGKLHSNVDALSRPPLDSPVEMPSIPARWEKQLDNIDLTETGDVPQDDSTLPVNTTNAIPMIQFNQNDVFDEDIPTKRVDPWDNEALLEFLRNGKFSSGTSRKLET